jgi:hypothetical protein
MAIVTARTVVVGHRCDGPFVERAEKEVVQVAVAAKESLEIGKRKVFGDIQQELGGDCDEVWRHDMIEPRCGWWRPRKAGQRDLYYSWRSGS